MATKKKSTKKSAKRTKPKNKTSVVVIRCGAKQGKTPCLQKAVMAELLCESLGSIIWHHRDDDAQQHEFVVMDSGIVPSGRPGGHFEISVTVAKLHHPDFKETQSEISLHEFLKTFIPSRSVDANDCNA